VSYKLLFRRRQQIKPNSGKRIIEVFTLLILIMNVFLGCTANESVTRTSPSIVPPQQTNSSTPAQSPNDKPTPPIEVKIDFPNGAPALNQIADLTCTIVNHQVTMKDMTVQITLPEGLQLAGGQLAWTGVVSTNTSFKAMDAKVKAVKLGNWTADIQYSIKVVAPSGLAERGSGSFYVLVGDNSAQWDQVRPPWLQGGQPGTAPVTSLRPGGGA
jgi:hypothetical protein